MTAPKPKDHPNVAVPPPLIFLGFLFAGYGLGKLIGDPGFGLGLELRRGAALTLIVGGLLLDGLAAGLFRRFDTAVEPWKPSTALVTSGPYRFSRNPIYVGFAITFVGLALAMDSWSALAALIPCLIVVEAFVIRPEERYLEGKFGREYLDYKARVRRWL